MAVDPTQFPRVLTIYLELTRYPILAARIRERMRRELFQRRVISPEAFESEVREKAIESQAREGLSDPFAEEPPDIWSTRLAITRDHLTDFYFAYNLPHDVFEDIVRQTLADRLPSEEVILSFHPELAPWDMLFAQGESFEKLPPDQRGPVEHHLQEIKVVLIKAMISDHLRYVGIAKEWFDVADLRAIRARRYGRGKIGGKAAGVMLAERILRKAGDPELLRRLHIPRSWFLGADVFYQFTQLNDLLVYVNQKYKPEDEIRAEFPVIRERFINGQFPPEAVDGLKEVLEQVGDTPLIVRSSSLLEDSFGTSFAGKYESFFCPNQSDPEENLGQLIQAIVRVYGSVYAPDVLLYRRRMGLLDYDERMAVLIQEVKGRRLNGYFFPDAAGVALSRNQFRWHPKIDRDAGFLRMVWGLGTRAVEQLGGDYPRLVALSHPELRPEAEPRLIQRYSQRQVDLIDLETNAVRTLPVAEVMNPRTPYLRWLAQRYEEGNLEDLLSLPLGLHSSDLVITFSGLLGRTAFPDLMRSMLSILEAAYRTPVDTEFLTLLVDRPDGTPDVEIYLLQCRPQSHIEVEQSILPKDIPESQVLFVCHRLIPDGAVRDVRYCIYVSPASYSSLSRSERIDLARLIGRLNERLSGEVFILMGPGRWGSENPDLGIPVAYGDIYCASALIEMTTDLIAPEPSYGTHFFQDLVEAQIFPLALALQDKDTSVNHVFIDGAENALPQLLPDASAWETILKVIDIPRAAGGAVLDLVMDGDAGTAMAYFRSVGEGQAPSA
jgi:hypothetical protein